MDRNQILNDPETAMRASLDGRQAQIWTTMPGIVANVRWSEMTVDVQPAIKGVLTDENGKLEFVNYPKLIHVPLVFPSAGGFILTLPIAVGDEVLVSWACRCIDSWWQSGGIQKPMEARMHDMSDGFAIPGPCSQPNVVPSISTTAAQLRNTAGTQYVSLKADGTIEIKSTTTTITGNLAVTGSITSNTGTVPHILGTHVHSGVTTGGGNSGPPV